MDANDHATREQPAPVASTYPVIWDQVIELNPIVLMMFRQFPNTPPLATHTAIEFRLAFGFVLSNEPPLGIIQVGRMTLNKNNQLRSKPLDGKLAKPSILRLVGIPPNCHRITVLTVAILDIHRLANVHEPASPGINEPVDTTPGQKLAAIFDFMHGHNLPKPPFRGFRGFSDKTRSM